MPSGLPIFFPNGHHRCKLLQSLDINFFVPRYFLGRFLPVMARCNHARLQPSIVPALVSVMASNHRKWFTAPHLGQYCCPICRPALTPQRHAQHRIVLWFDQRRGEQIIIGPFSDEMQAVFQGLAL
jgi:hypothetical protein